MSSGKCRPFCLDFNVLMAIRPLETNFSETLIEIQNFYSRKYIWCCYFPLDLLFPVELLLFVFTSDFAVFVFSIGFEPVDCVIYVMEDKGVVYI